MGKDDSNNEVGILEIPKDIGYWLVRADGGKYYEDFFLNNFIAISDNEVSLEKIKSYAENSLVGITIDHYKNLYNQTYPDWTNQQIAQAAGRTQRFLDEMKIGDLILVPSKRSTHFLLGTLTSDVYEAQDEELTSKAEVNHAVNQFLKRRRVQWLKEVSRNEISEKLYWVLSAHQTIFNLNEQKEYINQLLAPIYVQNGICHGTIKISKKKGLTLNEWYKLYSLVKKCSAEESEEVIVKSNVQSPGTIEFIVPSIPTIITLTIIFSGILIGEINTKRIKLKGIIPYFQSYKRENVEIKKLEKELELLDEDKKAKQLINQRAEFELERDKELWEIKKEAVPLGQQLQITNFDAGRIVANQTQMDNYSDQDADES